MTMISTIPRSANLNANSIKDYAWQPDLDLGQVSVRNATSTAITENSELYSFQTTPQKKEIIAPSPKVSIDQNADIDATVIQLWEGQVLAVDEQQEVLNVLLTAKMGQIPEHSAEIEMQWVSEQDRDLVVPGAVFYLTLYKKTRKGSIKNSQELRFRRRPSWTKQQVENIFSEAEKMQAKMFLRPDAA